MSQLRLNPLTGRWVTIAVDRGCPSRRPRLAPAPRGGRPVAAVPVLPGQRGGDAARPRDLRPAAASGSCGSCPTATPRSRATSRCGSTTSGRCSPRRWPAASTRCWCSRPTTRPRGPTSTTPRPAVTMAAIRDRIEDHGRAAADPLHAGHRQPRPRGRRQPRAPARPAARHPVRARRDRRRGGRVPPLRGLVPAVHDARGRRGRPPPRGATPTTGWWSCARSGRARRSRCWCMPRGHEVHVTDAEPPDVAAVGRAMRDVLAKLRGHRRATSPTTSCSTPRRTATPARTTGTCTCCPGSPAWPGSSRAPAC